MSINPAATRPAYWEPFVAAAREEKLVLQVCESCGSVNYPPSETCANCLSNDLQWQEVNGSGRVLAITEVQATPDDFYRPLLPLAMGSVKLDCGPVVFAFFLDKDLAAGEKVEVRTAMDIRGVPLLVVHGQDVSITSSDFDWKGSSFKQLFTG